MKGFLLIVGALVLCIVMAGLLTSALAGSDENGTVDAPGEKPAVNKVPVTPAEGPAPEESEEKTAAQKEPEILITGEATPPAEEELETREPTETTPATSTPSPAITTLSQFAGGTVANGNETGDAETEEIPAEEPSLNATTTTEYVDDSDDDEEDESPVPTLERYAPPRPSATMAKAHYSHDRPLVQSGHQIVNPGLPYTSGENETGIPSAAAVPRDGLFVRGIGVLLDRTPEDVALTRSGVEIANLDWLLDPAMLLGGRHPRAVLEGERFTVTVTVEARNVTITEENPAYVVLVPPPDETGVYEITRTREFRTLGDGERGVWEFSVVTRTGRLTLANLTLPEERLVTNLTSNPNLFAFQAYALAGDQEVPSSGFSDPVLAIRRDGSAETAEVSSLPGLYALSGVENSMLSPSETMAGAWARGVDHDAIVAAAVGDLEALSTLGKEEIAAVYDLEGGGAGGAQSAPSPSIFDQIVEFFEGLFGMNQERAS
ncbi:hypothetical protein [Methanoculleus sp. MH98A]|uniref:hypothetical protein n=1 Tax=Methanoculleus sp. MH98A TaxID=1495314 RepID=UPI00049EA539|nr:hypothetical protein [Methanoculleus sp. MH98A]KDE56535.1 hypothetical protein EI28_03750 [Methanoculleus sp. MH98A]